MTNLVAVFAYKAVAYCVWLTQSFGNQPIHSSLFFLMWAFQCSLIASVIPKYLAVLAYGFCVSLIPPASLINIFLEFRGGFCMIISNCQNYGIVEKVGDSFLFRLRNANCIEQIQHTNRWKFCIIYINSKQVLSYC